MLVEFWLLPLVCAQPMLWGQFIAQHTHTDQTDDMLRNGRAVDTTALHMALSWNMPLHSVHHLHPQIPFFNLPEAFRLLVCAEEEAKAASQAQAQAKPRPASPSKSAATVAASPVSKYQGLSYRSSSFFAVHLAILRRLMKRQQC